MKKLWLFVVLALPLAAAAQQSNSVYYHKQRNLLGSTETLVIPADSYYLVKRFYYGMIGGGTSVDTLFPHADGYANRVFRLVPTYTGPELSHLAGEWKIPAKRFTAYQARHPVVNKVQNVWYANRLLQQANNMANAAPGNATLPWYSRQKHTLEQLSRKDINRKTGIFRSMCHADFRAIADSVHQANLTFISNLGSGEK